MSDTPGLRDRKGFPIHENDSLVTKIAIALHEDNERRYADNNGPARPWEKLASHTRRNAKKQVKDVLRHAHIIHFHEAY